MPNMSPLRVVPFLFLLALNAHAALHITPQPARFPDADGTVPVRLYITNPIGDYALNLQVRYFDATVTPLGDTTSVNPVDWNCSRDGGLVTCNFRNVLGGDVTALLDLHVHFDQPYARRDLTVIASATVDGTVEQTSVTTSAALYKRFIVTQPGDTGDGSLRAAVEALDADPQCASVPCSIDFELEARSIALQSPLPRIVGRDVLVDDTSGRAGLITLDGTAVAGNALDFDGNERAEVGGLRIANFGDNAVLLRPRLTPSRLTVAGCTIEHNFRGINVAAGRLDQSLIRNNTLRDNVRTAIFDGSLGTGGANVPPLRIEGNTISGNGASGIYFAPGCDGALITGNRIESNHDFGIAVARSAVNVRILPNTIAHNGGAAIDVGLDGPTPLRPDNPALNAAVIESARFDEATQTTIITGKPSVAPIGICDLCFTHIVSLYANDTAEHGEYSEAQQYLGDAQPGGSGFVFTFKGNLIGKYITALSTSWVNGLGSDYFNTTELSKAVLVR
jgi:hypothetical protein